VYRPMPTPDTYWEKTVAPAAPFTPQSSTRTQTRSRITFRMADTARNASGTTELPMARRRFAK